MPSFREAASAWNTAWRSSAGVNGLGSAQTLSRSSAPLFERLLQRLERSAFDEDDGAHRTWFEPLIGGGLFVRGVRWTTDASGQSGPAIRPARSFRSACAGGGGPQAHSVPGSGLATLQPVRYNGHVPVCVPDPCVSSPQAPRGGLVTMAASTHGTWGSCAGRRIRTTHECS